MYRSLKIKSKHWPWMIGPPSFESILLPDLAPILCVDIVQFWCRDSNCSPEKWPTGWIYLFIKPQIPSKPETLRPICLQCAMNKIMTGLLQSPPPNCFPTGTTKCHNLIAAFRSRKILFSGHLRPLSTERNCYQCIQVPFQIWVFLFIIASDAKIILSIIVQSNFSHTHFGSPCVDNGGP